MFKKTFLIVACLFSSISAFSNPIKILILGDSLTAGYGVEKEKAFPALLEKKLKSSYSDQIEVLAAGISGSTTASGLKRLRWQLKKKPTHLLIALGANDGLRGFPVEETRKNILAMIELAKSNNLKTFIAGMQMPPNYGLKYRKNFEKIFTDLANQTSSPIFPFLLKDVAGMSDLNQPDQIHPNTKGHEIIAHHLFEYFKTQLQLKSK